tara:strand:- start:10495 stop:11400 length:906 start_codon:yes stop_codon:yes gene_type:complete
MLFFIVNSPDDMARAHLGEKHINQELINNWKEQRGYNLPLFYNKNKEGLDKIKDTLFFEKSIKLFQFNFGMSDSGRNITNDIKTRMWPSLAIAVPTLIIGLFFNIAFALLIVFFRFSYLDFLGVTICIILMSISSLFYIIGGQFLLSKYWHWVPISGYVEGLGAINFIILPILVNIMAGIGDNTRWYRSILLEEINKDYVATAISKGLPMRLVLFKHVLKNAMIPILTGIIIVLPFLFMGSLIIEAFFGIPGLGSYTIDAIVNQDFAVLRSMVFLGTVLYIIGLILTDIAYTIVDPRIRFS